MTARGEMPFLDHLEELRWRILRSLLAIIAGTVLGWFLLDKIDIIEILKQPIAPYLPGGRLIFTSPAEPFMLTLKVAFALGCLVASPLIIYQIWAFLAPALYERERRLIVPALAVGAVLFLAGAIACYEWLLPAALKVLTGFSRSDLTPMITIDRYFAMAVPFVAGCGLVAELPLAVTILAAHGIVTPQFLGRQRRYAFGIGAFLAAILTPPPQTERRTRDTAGVVKPPGGGGAQPDTGRRANVDSAAQKRGLPTGPSRSFPPADPVMDSLLKLQGYQVTRYMGDTMLVVGDS